MSLVAFDFDGTLSEDEMIVLLAERAGCAQQVADVTRRAMEGELSYAESLRERVALLEGLSETEVEDAYGDVGLREGTADVFEALAGAGVSTAILTGGFEDGVEDALAREGISADRIVANRLPMEGGELTGEVEGPLIEGTKDDALREVASDFGVPIEGTVAVGDGANDVPMLREAGTAIGFRPKSGVEEHCDRVVQTMGELLEAFEELNVV